MKSIQPPFIIHTSLYPSPLTTPKMSSPAKMQISQLYVYPIKSLRGIPLSTATLTRTGFHHDRRFMLLKVTQGDTDNNDTPTLKNMHVPHYPEMALFTTAFAYPPNNNTENPPNRIIITHHPPNPNPTPTLGQSQLEIPLNPSTHGLSTLNITMHGSPTVAYDMGSAYNAWFSARFGYDVVLAYLGGHARLVLGTFAPAKHRAHRVEASMSRLNRGGVVVVVVAVAVVVMVLSVNVNVSVAATVVAAAALYVMIRWLGWRAGDDKETRQEGGEEEEEDTITFADAAPYLLTSQTSLDNVSARLAGDVCADMTKFRPNLVVSGAADAFEEDFWAVLRVGDTEAKDDPNGQRHTRVTHGNAQLLLTANCVRCQSVNVDYATGQMGTGEAGTLLKKLMKDRRVDRGAKYSPVFGRYAFLDPRSEKMVVNVGDEVEVVRRMKERAIYDWPGLGN